MARQQPQATLCQQGKACAQAQRTTSRTLWCLSLLVVASSLCVVRAEPFGYGDSGSYGYGDYGSYGAYGSLSDAAPEQQYTPQERRLLAEQAVVPAVPAVITGSDDMDAIVPADVPATKSWDSLTWKSWEDWYSHHFSSNAAAAAYGTSTGYGYGSTGTYGDIDDIAPGQYGSYGSEGAYFDFRSGKTVYAATEQGTPYGTDGSISTQFSSESDDPIPAPGSTEELHSSPVEMPASADGTGARMGMAQQLQMDPAKPALGGVSRGRGQAFGVTSVHEGAAVANREPAWQPADKPPVTNPLRKLLSKVFGFSSNALSFSRRLHMSRAAAQEAGWATMGQGQ